MPARGRIPPFLIFFILALAFVALVGFEMAKERRIAGATLGDKELQLENALTELKEQTNLAHEREVERDFGQTKLLELERVSEATKVSLQSKETELQNMKAQYDKAVEELTNLKTVVKQKEDEIELVQKKLQEFSMGAAKDSADQISNTKIESALDIRQGVEHKPADEAGLADRKRLQDEEEAIKDGYVSATEKEMDERSKPKPDVLNEDERIRLAKIKEKEANEKTDESLRLGGFQEEEVEEQDNADTRDLDEKEIDASQEEDLNEATKTDSDLQAGGHEEESSHVIE